MIMRITNKYQAALGGEVLQCKGIGAEVTSAVLADAKIDLQPHQVSATLFALENPYLKGAFLLAISEKVSYHVL